MWRPNLGVIVLHLLIGLTVATLLIIGCFYGNLFACVFLSIVPGGAVLILCLQQLPGGSPSNPAWALVCAGLLACIWAPRYYRLRQITR